jgi:acetylornithine/succinyldiaminopimelate/putrescine aminotransferase
LATLKVLLQEDYIKEVGRKAQLFLSLLKHPSIVEIRQAGLLMAVELRDFEQVLAVIKQCLAGGLIVDWFLFNNRSIRIAPPLIITDDEIREACAIFLSALDRVG